MSAKVMIIGFLFFVLLMAFTVGVAVLCGYIGMRIKKKNIEQKKAEQEAKRAKNNRG